MMMMMMMTTCRLVVAIQIRQNCLLIHIQPDMERFFGIWKSKISAALNTFVDALYETALPYLSNPAIFYAANMMWGFYWWNTL
jgi:hypothetical protein